MPKGQRVAGTNRWTDSDEKRLLLIIIATPNFSKEWQSIAAKMGPTFSASAVSQKYQKLRVAAEKQFGTGSTGGTGSNGGTKRKASSQPATPSKSAQKGSKAGSAGNGNNIPDTDNDDDDDDFDQKPSKKSKSGIVKNERADSASPLHGKHKDVDFPRFFDDEEDYF